MLWLSVLASVVTASVVAPASGVAWGSKSSPLVAISGWAKVAQGYGDFVNSGSVAAKTSSYQMDSYANSYSVPINTHYYFYESCGDGTVGYCDYGWKDTSATSSNAWSYDSTSWKLSAKATKARATPRACEVLAWATDPCSAAAVCRSVTDVAGGIGCAVRCCSEHGDVGSLYPTCTKRAGQVKSRNLSRCHWTHRRERGGKERPDAGDRGQP